MTLFVFVASSKGEGVNSVAFRRLINFDILPSYNRQRHKKVHYRTIY